MSKMNHVVKKKWLRALRSGDYQQGTKYLRSTRCGELKHCCLGVLCELFLQENNSQKWHQDGEVFYLDGWRGVLPTPVMKWAELATTQVKVEETSLVRLNDDGTSFEEIADIIEEYL